MSGPNVKPEEKPLVDEFRKKLWDVLQKYDENFQSDLYLVRWLRARDMDLTKAETMLRNSLEWREKNNINEILNVTFEDSFAQAHPYTIAGYDKEGRPCCYMPAGLWDISKLVRDDKLDLYVQYVNHFFEKIAYAIRKCPSNKDAEVPHTQFTLIADFDQFSYRQLASLKVIQTMLNGAKTYEAHYPEILFHAILVNCDWIFAMFFKLLKPILASKTVGKIHIYGTNRLEWEEEALKLIEPDQLKIVLSENWDANAFT